MGKFCLLYLQNLNQIFLLLSIYISMPYSHLSYSTVVFILIFLASNLASCHTILHTKARVIKNKRKQKFHKYNHCFFLVLFLRWWSIASPIKSIILWLQDWEQFISQLFDYSYLGPLPCWSTTVQPHWLHFSILNMSKAIPPKGETKQSLPLEFYW